MTSSSSRQQHIERALADYRSKPPGAVETTRVPLRGASTVLEVIEVPLDVPILNADSFRIAPALEDHPKRQLVLDNPESAEAQEIVGDLVRKAHRSADALKESLLLDGQDNPGVITRSGKLINANSRCVLLRELVAEGRLQSAALRVAVLPSNVTNSEVLGLESVLQQQQEFKDEYTLVSKLMMIEKLHTDAGMTDEAIATSLREKKGARIISDLRAVLVLMNRARHLTSEPQPISTFAGDKDQQQNWLELLSQVRDIDRISGREAGNDHIRGWLLAYYSGFGSVHQLRHARGDWVKRDVVPMLASGNRVAQRVAEVATQAPRLSPPDAGDRAAKASSLGLDILDTDSGAEEHQGDGVVQTLLDLVSAARTAPERPIEIEPGAEADSEAVMSAIQAGVDEGIKASRRRTAGANKLARPQALATSAHGSLKAASEALEEVVGEPEFRVLASALSDMLTDVQTQLDDLVALLTTLDRNGERNSTAGDQE